jgi:two-component system, NarL family, nitrate/nitrite response regulator NarL
VTSKPARVMIAESQLPTRQGIRLLLQRNGFQICAEVGDATAALRAALRERPALCLVDTNLRGGGIRVVGRISSRVPETEVVVLADAVDEDELLEALRAGASGYLQKNLDPEAFGRALHGALRGEPAFPRSLLGLVVEEFRARHDRRRLRVPGRPAIELSRRESEVLDLLRRGLATAEIADRLDISPVTVRRHIGLLLRKLGVPNRAAALKLLERSRS